ncbi:hypothetical protein, partial [Rufibacter ruber]|uniref:hypothetical protein n=1 Tax=Rufibacter ruber TaxID=1783499 RepID=UPI0019D3D9CC
CFRENSPETEKVCVGVVSSFEGMGLAVASALAMCGLLFPLLGSLLQCLYFRNAWSAVPLALAVDAMPYSLRCFIFTGERSRPRGHVLAVSTAVKTRPSGLAAGAAPY